MSFGVAPPQGIRATGILASTISTAHTWSANQTFSAGATFGDTVVVAEGGDNVLNVRNGTNAQDFRVWNTYTSDSEGEYGELFWSSNVFNIRTIGVGGGSNRAISFDSAGAPISFRAGGVTLFAMGSSAFYPQTTSIFDLGTSALRFRDVHLNRWAQLTETTSDPSTSDLGADAEIAVYTKSDKFVIAYNNGGTITYITIPLDGSTTTWTHGTSAP